MTNKKMRFRVDGTKVFVGDQMVALCADGPSARLLVSAWTEAARPAMQVLELFEGAARAASTVLSASAQAQKPKAKRVTTKHMGKLSDRVMSAMRTTDQPVRVAWIAAQCGVTTQTLRATLRDLVEAGAIKPVGMDTNGGRGRPAMMYVLGGAR